MLNPEIVFIIGILTTVSITWGYTFGALSLRALAFIGGPAIFATLAATIAIEMAPPAPPLSPAEKAKQKARDDGYVLGLATGMMMPR